MARRKRVKGGGPSDGSAAPTEAPRDPLVQVRNAVARSRAAGSGEPPSPAAADSGEVEALADVATPENRVIGTAGGSSGLTPTTDISSVGDGRT